MTNAGAALSMVFVLLCAAATPAAAQEPLLVSRQQLRNALLFGPPAASPAAPPARPRVGFDKVQHFTFSFLWTVGTQYTLVVKAEMGEGEALPLSVASAVAVGVAKEVYDERREEGTGFSRADLVADGLGIVAAVGLILL